MKKTLIIVIVLVVLAGSIYALMQRGGIVLAQPARAAQPTPAIPAVQASDEVVVDAVVVPVHRATLSMAVGGVVAEAPVREGDVVAAGQLLVRLQDAREQAAVAQAEARLQSAQAHLAELQAGPRSQELDAARASLEAAQARLRRVGEAERPQAVAAAEASLAAAQAELKRLLAGPDAADLAAVQAELANAEAALRQAQSAYDEVAWHSNVGMLPQSLRLEEATNNYAAAQAHYDHVAQGATDDAIAQAQAGVRQAQAELDRVKAPATESEIAEAEAEVGQALAQYELLAAGTRSEAIAAAQAAVAEAEASLLQAQAALAETRLLAPFAGTVAAIDATVGEQLGAGTPVVRMADLSAWQVETEDLTELSVVRVQSGDAATIRFDALPDVELAGQVDTIRSFGENRQGDITYMAVVRPTQVDARLRWNMTAVVTIRPS